MALFFLRDGCIYDSFAIRALLQLRHALCYKLQTLLFWGGYSFFEALCCKKNISTYGRVCCRGYLLDRHLLPHHPTHASHLSPPPSSHALPAHTHLLPAVTARHHHSHAQPHYMLRTACPIASFFRWWPARPRPPRVVLSIRSSGEGGHDPLPPYPEAAALVDAATALRSQ